MSAIERPILWEPSEERIASSQMTKFEAWLKQTRGLTFSDYNDLWRWSVSDLDAFWPAICEFFQISFSKPATATLGKRGVENAEWFPGAELNWARQILTNGQKTPEKQALIVRSETFGRSEMTWRQLSQAVANCAASLREMGVGQGDRVTAVLPNTETAIIACLATASLGAIWSLCAPDMGHVAILDRFQQIEPKVLIYQDGYVHAGKTIDRRPALDEIIAGLPSVTHHVVLPVVGDLPDGSTHWNDVISGAHDLRFSEVEFEHPLWVVYSSGTTGNPKPIVHGHGGILLESYKKSLHQDLTAETRFFWLTSSGWVMWNAQFCALGQGAATLLYDGAPNHPDMMALWRVIDEEDISSFGAGAAYIAACAKSGIRPNAELDLTALNAIGATGSPLTADGYDWVFDAVNQDIWLAPISGGTDFCGAFVCGNVNLPVRSGEMQCRALGNAVRAYDIDGNDMIGTVGELVCTEPLPSMPLFFWGDTDGSRLHDSYFDTYPGVWRHGDWIEITETGGSVIYGRSDATINRRGLRLGSSEIYQAVEALDFVLDSLVVDLEYLGRDSFMPLFVVLADAVVLDAEKTEEIKSAIRQSVSARFVPDEILQVAEIPRTISGKKLEVPVKKLLLGGDADKVVNRDSMANPDSFDIFIDYASRKTA